MGKIYWVAILLLIIGLHFDSQPVAVKKGIALANKSSTKPNLPAVPSKKTTLGPNEVAIVINDSDPLSVKIGNYYRLRRKIPEQNVKHISFIPGKAVMTAKEFSRIKQQLDKMTAHTVQAYALTWYMPYRVDCMSITTAFAMGYDKAFCADTCAKTKISPYFNSNSRAPFTDLGIRPTMMLAATTYNKAKALIDRGIKADATYPLGTGYLLDTSDKNRNVRAASYDRIVSYLGGAINLEIVKGDYIKNKPDVLFYFTGVAQVKHLSDNIFRPGAIADHLTSAGGIPNGEDQMPSIKWLDAGATGSYGAVVEPCNFPEKFPAPSVVIDRYSSGETLLEAYWKSVRMPGQGVYLGDLLAKPF